jgi:hypothetical protein
MNRASEVSKKIWEQRSMNESIFVFEGPQHASDAASTGTTTNLEDCFRSKGYVNGREYWWEGPRILHINDAAIDRDILDFVELNAKQVLDPNYEKP